MYIQWTNGDSEARFSNYVEELSACLGHADRMASYCVINLFTHNNALL